MPPLFARKAYWSIVETLKVSGFETAPFHTYVPSFGEWGFVVASFGPYAVPEKYPDGLRFLAPEVVPTLFKFPTDMAPVEVEANHLNDQILVRYYEDEWRRLPG